MGAFRESVLWAATQNFPPVLFGGGGALGPRPLPAVPVTAAQPVALVAFCPPPFG